MDLLHRCYPCCLPSLTTLRTHRPSNHTGMHSLPCPRIRPPGHIIYRCQLWPTPLSRYFRAHPATSWTRGTQHCLLHLRCGPCTGRLGCPARASHAKFEYTDLHHTRHGSACMRSYPPLPFPLPIPFRGRSSPRHRERVSPASSAHHSLLKCSSNAISQPSVFRAFHGQDRTAIGAHRRAPLAADGPPYCTS
jgi:hypothetical protein